jgi:hypothetical protein
MQTRAIPVLSCSSSSNFLSLGSLSTKSPSSDRTLGLDHNSDNSGLPNELRSLDPQPLLQYPSAPLLRADTQHAQSERASVFPPPSHKTRYASSKELQKRQPPNYNYKTQVDEELGEPSINTDRRKGRASTVAWIITIITILSIVSLGITSGLLAKDPAVGLSSAATGFELVVCVVALLHALD